MKKRRVCIAIVIIFPFLFLSQFVAASTFEENKLNENFRVSDHTPYVSGYGDNVFGPNRNITRAEVAQCLYNLLKKTSSVTETRFSDVSLDQWYGQAVNYLSYIGVFSGYGDGTFKPNNPITRAELVSALTNCVSPVEAENPFSDVVADHWAFHSIITAVANNWISGYPDGTFQPQRTITRAETVVILNRAMERTGEGYAENRTGQYFVDIKEVNWAYLDIVEASGAVAYNSGNEPNDSDKVQVTVSALNMRSGPGTNYSILRTLSKNTLLNVIDEINSPWLHVMTQDGLEGYVHEDYISSVDIPTPPPAESAQVQVDVSALNMRSGPGTNFDIIGVLRENTLLYLIDKNDAPWLHVKTQDGTEGYVLADYVSDYTPNTTPAERITLSASSINMNQYKSVRLDGVSTPNVSLVWRSSNEDVVTVSTIRYSEGDESCIVYGKSPGTATVYCSDYAGTIQVECFVTVSEAEPVRFVYTEPNLVTSNTAMNLVAITDSQKTAVEFILEDNMGNQIANGEVSTPSVEENRNNKTNVFRFSVGTLSEGEYRVKIYSTDGIAKYEMKEDYVFIVHPFNADTVTTEEHRTISDKMIEVIMDYEAYSPTIYDDPLAPKHPTVGYGLVVNINESFYNNMTQREAKALLINSIDSNYGEAVNSFRQKYNLKMSQCQFDALVSFTYNLGPGYMNNPSGNNLFTTILNAVVPPSSISVNNPCSGVLNVADALLYESPARNAVEKKNIAKGTVMNVIGVQRNSENKELWYYVRVGSDVGWMRAGNIHLNLDAVHDLNCVDSMTFATYILAYHHANKECIPGLLFRRLGEAKLFLYGDYNNASPNSVNYRNNTYNFIYPNCIKQYE